MPHVPLYDTSVLQRLITDDLRQLKRELSRAGLAQIVATDMLIA